jgi:hypothetical protein
MLYVQEAAGNNGSGRNRVRTVVYGNGDGEPSTPIYLVGAACVVFLFALVLSCRVRWLLDNLPDEVLRFMDNKGCLWVFTAVQVSTTVEHGQVNVGTS